MGYGNELTNEINESHRERDALKIGIGTSKKDFAEYLKNNFDSQVAEIVEAQEKEKNKSKFKKFIEKLIKTL